LAISTDRFSYSEEGVQRNILDGKSSKFDGRKGLMQGVFVVGCCSFDFCLLCDGKVKCVGLSYLRTVFFFFLLPCMLYFFKRGGLAEIC